MLQEAFAAAIERCQPGASLVARLPVPPAAGRLLILAAGKAAARMAEVAESHYASTCPESRFGGLAVAPHGTSADLRSVELLHASHPFPDEHSEVAARRFLAAARELGPGDHLLMLLSGGASSLLCAPVPGITLDEKRAVTEALFSAGAPIGHINLVRAHLSRIKGGKLGQACWPARLTTLAISDVVGDDPRIIGSAPTAIIEESGCGVPDVLARYEIDLPAAVRERLLEPCGTAEQPFPEHEYHIVARPMDGLEAAAAVTEASGYRTTILGDDIEGEAAEEARRMLAADEGAPDVARAVLSGGEVTVTLGDGESFGYGGPNREFALALAIEMDARDGYSALIADSDGVDGQSGRRGPVAGALVDSSTVRRAAEIDLDACEYLERHDSGTFFEKLGDEVVTGPTQTNVNDFRLLLAR